MRPTRTDPPQKAPAGPHRLRLPAAGLRLLRDAHAGAGAAAADPWQFAVPIESLREAGLTDAQLRWLLQKGYAAQGVERTSLRSPGRRFQPVQNLSLRPGACFVLTEAGADWSRQVCRRRGKDGGEPGNGRTPHWDGARRELRVGRVVVKRFRQSAPSQTLLLDALQELGWPPRTDDPLPPRAGVGAKTRLHSALSNLNRHQETKLIQFGGGGDGRSIRWRLLELDGKR
jgi:hypothetical protein